MKRNLDQEREAARIRQIRNVFFAIKRKDDTCYEEKLIIEAMAIWLCSRHEVEEVINKLIDRGFLKYIGKSPKRLLWTEEKDDHTDSLYY